MQFAHGRDSQLDLIRGVAIVGIVFLNVFSFAIPSWYSFDLYWHQQGITELDKALYQLQQVFFQGRFRTLLTLLFGIGLWLVAKPLLAANASQSEARRQQVRRRYLGLALFGFCHLSFFWTGDITFWYALSALLLLAMGCLQLTAAAQWRLGLVLISLTVLFNYAAAWATMLSEPSLIVGLSDTEILAAQALQQGPILALWQEMLLENWIGFLSFCFNLCWLNIGTMLIGIALYRQGFFQHGMQRWQEVLLLFIAIVLDSVGLLVDTSMLRLANFWYDFTALLMALVFCSWLVKWRSHGRLSHTLQMSGQMALSLYFLQTLLFLTWFRALQPDWYANAERWQLLILASAVAIISLIFAVIWRHFFKTGPLEWCWRKFYQREAKDVTVLS
jgi:uncharacterized protein